MIKNVDKKNYIKQNDLKKNTTQKKYKKTLYDHDDPGLSTLFGYTTSLCTDNIS